MTHVDDDTNKNIQRQGDIKRWFIDQYDVLDEKMGSFASQSLNENAALPVRLTTQRMKNEEKYYDRSR